MLFLLFLLIFTFSAADEGCLTPTQQLGKCVLINHCPHLLSSVLRNQTDSKGHIKKSHCGFESLFFPKVCCPLEAVKYFEEGGAISQNQHATKCGLHEPDSPADPWLVSLEYEKNNREREFLCAGVLINKRYVLTAAHCIRGQNVLNYRLVNVHLGKFNESLVVPVDGTTVHQEYNPYNANQYNDIALVRLKNKVNFKDGEVRPICIPGDNKKDFVRKTLSVTGYEKHGEGAKKRDGVATVWENSECHLAYHITEVRLRDSQICAGGRRLHYRHSHRIDLGGVLMHVGRDNSYTAVGILSLEASCCNKDNYPKVYTRIGSYIEWIFANLKA